MEFSCSLKATTAGASLTCTLEPDLKLNPYICPRNASMEYEAGYHPLSTQNVCSPPIILIITVITIRKKYDNEREDNYEEEADMTKSQTKKRKMTTKNDNHVSV